MYRLLEPCARCGSEATTADGACQACGYVWGPEHTCVHCGEIRPLIDRAPLGCVCAGCGLPRIAPRWQMAPAQAERLRAAVEVRERTRKVAVVAVVIATACVPLGLLAGDVAGFGGWLGTLVAWAVSLGFAVLARRRGVVRLDAELAAARLAWERRAVEGRARVADSAEEPAPADRVRVAPVDTSEEEDVIEPASARRQSS